MSYEDRLEEQVTISTKELERLISDSIKLDALFAAGVDNWEGFDEAMAIFRGEA